MRKAAPRLKRDRPAFRLLLLLAPLHALKVAAYELNMLWIRLTNTRTDRRFRDAAGLLVNVGCGDQGKQGWVNVDSVSAPGVTCVYDCRRRIPLPDGVAAGIFTEHLVEHLDYDEEVEVFLSECRRVLEPGGTLRIVVPDGERYLLAYAQGGWDALRAFSPLVTETPGFRTRMEVVNAHFRQAGQHRFSYDFETLAAALERSGFDAVVRSEFGRSRLPALAIDAEARKAESLYVEGVKPGSAG